MRLFNELIADFGLSDPPLYNSRFTWSASQGAAKCSRLDRFLFSEGWRGSFPFCVHEIRFRGVSGHFPITINIFPDKWGPSPFRLDNSWLDNKDFKVLVNDWRGSTDQQGWEGFCFMRKLKGLKEKDQSGLCQKGSKLRV